MKRFLAFGIALAAISGGCTASTETTSTDPSPANSSTSADPLDPALFGPGENADQPTREDLADEIGKAADLLQAGDQDGAIASLEAAFPGESKPAEVHSILGEIFTDRREYARGIEELTKAVWGDPHDMDAYYHRAHCYSMTGQIDLAIDDLTMIVKTLSPTDRAVAAPSDGESRLLYIALVGRGNAYLLKEDIEGAFAEFTQAIEVDPSNAEAWALRGSLHRERGRGEDARRDIDKAIEIAPDRPLVVYEKLKLERHPEFGDEAAADEWLEKLLEISPPGSHYYHPSRLMRGQTRLERRDYAGGVADLQEYLECDQDPAVMNLIAWALATCPDDAVRDGERARQLAEKACELSEWNEPLYRDTLAAAHAELGAYDQAIEHAEKALENADFASEFGEDARVRLNEYREGKPHREL